MLATTLGFESRDSNGAESMFILWMLFKLEQAWELVIPLSFCGSILFWILRKRVRKGGTDQDEYFEKGFTEKLFHYLD